MWPVNPVGDGLWYHLFARDILRFGTYQFSDGSPGCLWPPGWSGVLAALYFVFGDHPEVGVIANALSGAATVSLIIFLGTNLFDRRTGLIAGGLYAIWPGLIFYVPTMYTESFFNLLLALLLTCLAVGGSRTTARRGAWFGAAGLLLGACALVRGEPLILIPMLGVYLWAVRTSASPFLRSCAMVFFAAALVILPWTVRNYLRLGKFLLVSANGGWVVYYGNHEGARGGYDGVDKATNYQRDHRGNTVAETFLNVQSAALRDTWQFIRTTPGAWVSIMPRKLGQTYLTDRDALDLLSPRMSERVYYWLFWGANYFWRCILVLAAIGIAGVRQWQPRAKVLVLGLFITWFIFHLLTIGEDRYHVPETLALALMAAQGIQLGLSTVFRVLARNRTAASAVPSLPQSLLLGASSPKP